jgi:hypothetical protein
VRASSRRPPGLANRLFCCLAIQLRFAGLPHCSCSPRLGLAAPWRTAWTAAPRWPLACPSLPSFNHEGATDPSPPACSRRKTTRVFVPIKPGRYPLRCTVKGHTEGGMVGEVVVRPAPGSPAKGPK